MQYFSFLKRKLLPNCFCTGANICRHDKGLLFKCVSCEIINHCVTVFENHNKESHVIGHQDVTYRRLHLFHLLVALASVHDDIACISSNKQVSPYLLHNTQIPSILFPRYIYLLSNYSHMNPQETYHSIIHTI